MRKLQLFTPRMLVRGVTAGSGSAAGGAASIGERKAASTARYASCRLAHTLAVDPEDGRGLQRAKFDPNHRTSLRVGDPTLEGSLDATPSSCFVRLADGGARDRYSFGTGPLRCNASLVALRSLSENFGFDSDILQLIPPQLAAK